MVILSSIVLLGFPLACILAFSVMRPKIAAAVCLIGGWLLLPMSAVALPVIPPFNKALAIGLGIILSAALFDNQSLRKLRFKWIDLPIFFLCFSPIPTALTNNLGIWEGMSHAYLMLANWGAAYFVGRVYFADLEGIKILATAIFIGGLLYIPLVLFEVRFSPQLHRLVYGVRHFKFDQAIRDGGYRPVVFLQHGLALGMWITASVVCGFSLWRARLLSKYGPTLVSCAIGLLGVTMVLCRSRGALLLALLGLLFFYLVRSRKTLWPLIVLMLLPSAYVVSRVSGAWDGEPITSMARVVSEDRASSLQFRLDNEDLLIGRANRRPLFGWGRFGRSRVHDERGRDITTTDGMWIIIYGQLGLLGLGSLLALTVVPIWLIIKHFKNAIWQRPDLTPLLALIIVAGLAAIDNLPNAMFSSVFVAVIGSLTGCAAMDEWKRVRGRPRRRPVNRPGPRDLSHGGPDRPGVNNSLATMKSVLS